MAHSDSEQRRRKSDHLSTIAKITGDVRVMLPLVVVLFGGTAYNFEAVRNVVNGGPRLASVEDVTQPIDDVHPEVARSIGEIVAKLKAHDASLAKLRRDFNNGDGSLDKRVTRIEGLVQ